MKFTYRSGQQPLPGYTIKRGIGLGGFGEVYFAVTEGGKEVALKWIRSNHDIEMRGVAQCLNLKHPNLVHLYDVREDASGNHWLVMEYVAGEPLSTILSRHPNGVAPELASQWFNGLAQVIHCLHEHGIVHRDLKPGNIFLENGLIKVGDYGLCKLMADSQHAGMTKDVGTVHYMAPEISTGNYNRQIDIYAAGILFYEMLTGQVPFDGESAGEILMKHLTAPPDLTRVPKEFVPVLEKALTKNPANRYQSIGEMAKAVAAVGERQQRLARRPGARCAAASLLKKGRRGRRDSDGDSGYADDDLSAALVGAVRHPSLVGDDRRSDGGRLDASSSAAGIHANLASCHGRSCRSFSWRSPAHGAY